MDEQRKRFGERLRIARTRAGVSQQEIARTIGISKQLVSHWETARSEINVFDAVRVASIVKADLGWLLTGVEDDKEVSVNQRPAAGTLVPKLSAGQLINLARGRIQSSDAFEMRASYEPVSHRALSFEVFDRAMEPRFPTGSVVIVDPERAPEPGDCIAVALLASGEVLFGRYRPKPESRLAQPPFTMRFDNPDFEARLITLAHEPVFVGTMMEHLVATSR